MTRATAFIAAFVILVLGAFYYYSPYQAAAQIQAAARQHDAATLTSFVDMPAVRESLRSQISAMLAKQGEDDPKSNPLRDLGNAMLANMAGPLVDQMTTPEALTQFVDAGQGTPKGEPEGSPAVFSSQYISLDTFRLTSASSQSDRALVLVLERRGLFAWKVERMELHVNEGMGKAPASTTSATSSVSAPATAPTGDTVATASPAAEPSPEALPVTGSDNRAFTEFPAERLSTAFVGPNLTPASDGWTFRSRYRDLAAEGANFAGRYAVTQVGCGAECTFVLGIDGADGSILDFPVGGEDYLNLTLIYHPDSSLMKAYWNPDEAGTSCQHVDLVIENGKLRRLPGDGGRVACPAG